MLHKLLFWYVYGDMTFSDQLNYCYLIGSIINCVLMVFYLAYEVKKYLIDSNLNTLILITGTQALYRVLVIIIDDDRIVGKICVGTSFIVYLAPIQIIYKVIKEKNYILIPIYNCYLIVLYSFCWIVYGALLTDYYIIVSFSAAIVLSFIEILIYLNYKRKYPTIGENLVLLQVLKLLEMMNLIKKKKCLLNLKKKKSKVKINLLKYQQKIKLKYEVFIGKKLKIIDLML